MSRAALISASVSPFDPMRVVISADQTLNGETRSPGDESFDSKFERNFRIPRENLWDPRIKVLEYSLGPMKSASSFQAGSVSLKHCSNDPPSVDDVVDDGRGDDNSGDGDDVTGLWRGLLKILLFLMGSTPDSLEESEDNLRIDKT